MRKIYTILAAFAITIISFSNIYGKSLEVIQADSNNYAEPAQDEIIAYADLKNTSTTAGVFNVKMIMKNLTWGHEAAFCTNTCFSPKTTDWTSPATFTVEPGQKVSESLALIIGADKAEFSGHLYPHGIPGVSKIVYRFFNTNDETDYTDVEIVFHVGSTSVNESTPVISKVSAYPNPAVNYVTINSVSAMNSINIYNATGSLVRVIETNGINEAKIDVSDLPAGTYYPVVLSGNNAVNGAAFVVNK